ncbi:hypothetical protein LCGC14_1043490 [marine sediment metagenome]|uniref:Uncharacterized protein n=1 Tax=marine sediment metagenome TaxID=412755 RepID=A0A0F9MVG3_9ZZZZ
MRFGLRTIYVLVCLTFAVQVNAQPSSFYQAKQWSQKVYSVHPETFYCGCRITWKRSTSGGYPDLQSCGYSIRSAGPRANRTEWEHVVPAYSMAHQRACWREGGRENCRRTDPVFEQMEADMFNLVPAVGEINGDRKAYRFGMLPGEPNQYGRCSAKISSSQRVMEPRPEVRGDIARTYFYMSQQYGLKISKQQQRLFKAWDKQDPVDDWERSRELRIAKYMGHGNPFVRNAKPWSAGKTSNLASAAVEPAVSRERDLGEIRGNRNSMIYHRPDCPSYDRMAPRNIVPFESSEHARNAGYRVAGNCP